MNISINLLPIEFRAEEVKKAKFYKIQALGVVVILITIFFSSLTIALGILQSQSIKVAQTTVTQQESKVSDFKTTENSLFLLKNRLAAISQFEGKLSKQNETYQSLSQTLSAAVNITSLNIDRLGNALVVASLPDISMLDSSMDLLIDEEQSKFKEVAIDSLSRGRDGVFRVSFKLTPK